MAEKQLKKDDKVEWEISRRKTEGTIKRKLTAPAKIKGHKVAASKENPEYLVEATKPANRRRTKPKL